MQNGLTTLTLRITEIKMCFACGGIVWGTDYDLNVMSCSATALILILQ